MKWKEKILDDYGFKTIMAALAILIGAWASKFFKDPFAIWICGAFTAFLYCWIIEERPPKKEKGVPPAPAMRERTHPGRILKNHYMGPRNLTTGDLAHIYNIPYKRLRGIVTEKEPITPHMAQWLSTALNTTPELWINLQKNYDEMKAEKGFQYECCDCGKRVGLDHTCG